MFLIVSDIEAAHDYLVGRGVEVSEVFHLGPDGQVQRFAIPTTASYGSLATFSDPDGNRWLLQEITDPPARPHRFCGDDVRFGD